MVKNYCKVTDNTETLMEYIDNSKTLYDETKAEPHVQFYDNAVTQMDVDAYNISSLEEHELHELSVQILNELQGMMPNTFKKYDKVYYPMVISMDYNSYPVPFHAGDGLVVSTCFSKAWDKSWGGEYITYHDTEPEDVVSIFPGRIYVAHGRAWNRISQPNIQAKHKLEFVQFRLN